METTNLHAMLIDGTVTNHEELHIEDASRRKQVSDQSKRSIQFQKELGMLAGVDVEMNLLTHHKNGSGNMFIHRLVEMNVTIDTPELRANGAHTDSVHAPCNQVGRILRDSR